MTMWPLQLCVIILATLLYGALRANFTDSTLGGPHFQIIVFADRDMLGMPLMPRVRPLLPPLLSSLPSLPSLPSLSSIEWGKS